ncbi:MAG: molecular chaperone TorD family protein [Planctomycetota bacterium]
MTPSVELAAVARLFGRLLLHELDEEGRAALLEPEVSEALIALGLELDELAPGCDLDQLAAVYLEAFLQPREGGPLVHSLWTGGAYEGEPAVAVRRLAAAAGVELDRAAARGAPPDHLGCLLFLWAATCEEAPEVAARIEADHLGWAFAPLARTGAGKGFYPSLARAVAAFLRELGARA